MTFDSRIAVPFAKDLTLEPGRMRLLLVEDQLFDLTRLRRLVETFDIETEIAEAASIAEMKSALQTAFFDLVLIDHWLPDGSALQTLEALRQVTYHRNIATILVAENATESLVLNSLARGFGDVIRKSDLCPAGLRRATLNALQKSRLVDGLLANVKAEEHPVARVYALRRG